MNQNESAGKKEHFVDVSVVTTSGSFPSQDFEQVPNHQKVQIQLNKAAEHLRITDTAAWIATVNSREIKIDASYLDNQLSGQVEIDYGPRESGGGRCTY